MITTDLSERLQSVALNALREIAGCNRKFVHAARHGHCAAARFALPGFHRRLPPHRWAGTVGDVA